MIPRKIIEAFFRRLWLIAVPVVLVPLAVFLLVRPETEYQSTATVWVDRSLGGAALIGEVSQWTTPAEHQSTAVNEMLSTDRFRKAVLTRAELVDGDASRTEVARVWRLVSVGAAERGSNLIAVTARSPDPDVSATLVDATIVEFGERFSTEVTRTATAEIEHYEEQLVLAEEELQEREGALREYIRANPEVASGDAVGATDLNYRTLVNQVEQQLSLVNELNESVQSAERQMASAPQAFSSGFIVQDPPEAPNNPVPTSIVERSGMPLAGLALGMAISMTYLYLSYRTDHTVRSAEDLGSLGLPVLGTVPELQPGRGLAARFPLGTLLRWRRRDFAWSAASAITEAPPERQKGGRDGRNGHG